MLGDRERVKEEEKQSRIKKERMKHKQEGPLIHVIKSIGDQIRFPQETCMQSHSSLTKSKQFNRNLQKINLVTPNVSSIIKHF